jgi:hypothetical protein
MRTRGRTEVLLAAALALVSVGAAVAGQEVGWLRAVLVLPLVFFLPGYVLVAALFPGRGAGLRAEERAMLSIGLSLALVALGGLLLNQTPWGLQADSWAALLGLFTLAAAVVAVLRPPRPAPGGSPQGTAEGGGGAAAPLRLLPPLGVRHGLAFAGAAAILTGAVAIAHQGAQAQRVATGFTQLWLLPSAPSGTGSGALRLGLRNAEPRPETYSLRVTVDGVQTESWPAIVLAPGQTWETTVASAPQGEVEALLSRADAPQQIYRRVTLPSDRGPGSGP